MLKRDKEIFPANYGGLDFRSRTEIKQFSEFEWIPDYRKKLAYTAELDDVKKLLASTKTSACTKSDMLKYAKIHYAEYAAERRGLIQKAVCMPRANRNPFDKLTSNAALHGYNTGTTAFSSFLSWEEIQAAIEAIPNDPAALSEKDREKALEFCQKRIEKLKIGLEEIFGKRSRFRYSGMNSPDGREALVIQWREIQSLVDRPCDMFGVLLKYSPQPEQDAYHELGIANFCKKTNKYKPIDPV